MNKSLNHTQKGKINAKITISGSKSESNRALVLQHLIPHIVIENCSDSDDTVVLNQAIQTTSEWVDIHHAGTAMRFLTAFFSLQTGKKVVLTGSERMQQRPIGKLVDVLRGLGANILYLNQNGYPPIQITGQKLIGKSITIDASQSSQFVSALLLIAPFIENGLEMELTGEVTSEPYLNMTIALLQKVGVSVNRHSHLIQVSTYDYSHNKNKAHTIMVESDWSSASYYYSIMAFADTGSTITLSAFHKNSLQADRVIAELYQNFGVETQFDYPTIIVKKTNDCKVPTHFTYDFSNCPDIAQTVAVTCLGLGISAHFTGLHTLKIKETDRILALKNELEKLGATVTTTHNSLAFQTPQTLNRHVTISTYNDHRMAMAFAPLALKTPLSIENAEVVSKSYPNFWFDFQEVTK